MIKHAYLIIAHKNPSQLNCLLRLLDDERNDIFLLIDANSTAIPETEIFADVCLLSDLILVEQCRICWGGYSQIEAELALFETASNRAHYAYYHLISGQDLPLHHQDYIHAFFKQYGGYEFLTFVGEEIYQREHPIDRIRYYHPAMDSKACGVVKKCQMKVQSKILLPVQKLLHIDRCFSFEEELGYGSNWVSLTDAFVHYILDQKEWIKRTFCSGWCVDELFVHTLAVNSSFKDAIFLAEGVHDRREDRQGNLRYINWWTGSPRTWRMEDRDELLEAMRRGYLFSRKFDASVDQNIIDFVADTVNNEKMGEICVTL